MKTIKERAIEYANSSTTLFMDSPEEDIIYRDDIVNGYIAGAIDERKELLRWREPKEEQPEDGATVLGTTFRDHEILQQYMVDMGTSLLGRPFR